MSMLDAGAVPKPFYEKKQELRQVREFARLALTEEAKVRLESATWVKTLLKSVSVRAVVNSCCAKFVRSQGDYTTLLQISIFHCAVLPCPDSTD